MVKHLKPGDPAPPLRLPMAAGGAFDSGALRGRRWLLAFHRYSL